MNALREFWFGAVFLRLSPNELAKASPATRASYAPLLDETGKNLPALLKHFHLERQISQLISIIQLAMPDFSDIEVSRPMVPSGRHLFFPGGDDASQGGEPDAKGMPIPSWMLSEGTRRITAILSLLQSIPPPTFLCIEEIENGLDYATVLLVLAQLRSASDDGIQVLATTHSIWLLDEIAFEDIIYVERVEGITVYTPLCGQGVSQGLQGSGATWDCVRKGALMARKKVQKTVALFVEGSSISTRQRQSALETIWQTHLVDVLGLIKIDRVVGISKKDILAVFPLS